MEFLNLANAWSENVNNDPILTNDTKVVLTGITDARSASRSVARPLLLCRYSP